MRAAAKPTSSSCSTARAPTSCSPATPARSATRCSRTRPLSGLLDPRRAEMPRCAAAIWAPRVRGAALPAAAVLARTRRRDVCVAARRRAAVRAVVRRARSAQTRAATADHRDESARAAALRRSQLDGPQPRGSAPVSRPRRRRVRASDCRRVSLRRPRDQARAARRGKGRGARQRAGAPGQGRLRDAPVGVAGQARRARRGSPMCCSIATRALVDGSIPGRRSRPSRRSLARSQRDLARTQRRTLGSRAVLRLRAAAGVRI